jgi:hypothetical protein
LLAFPPSRRLRKLCQALAAGVGALAAVGGGSQAASPVKNSSAAKKVPITHVTLPLPTGETGVARGIVAWNNGFVAVGESGGRAAVWESPDGQAWAAPGAAAVAHDARAEHEAILNVAVDTNRLIGGGFLVRGERPIAAVWTAASPSGTWSLQLLEGRRPSEVNSTAVARDVAIAGGERGPYDDADAAVWIAHGGTWRAVTDASLGGEGRQTISAVTSSEDAFVAVGSDRGVPTIWESPSGTSWRRVKMPASLRQADELTAVAVRRGIAVAVGNSEDGAKIWRSTKRGQWAAVRVPRSVSLDRHLNAITSSSDFLAAGFVNHPQGDPNASILVSRTGKSWSPLPTDPALAGRATQTIYGAATGRAYVAFAGGDYFDGPRPVVWVFAAH